jgi:hypothetical protein
MRPTAQPVAWGLAFADETWWTRRAHPAPHSWTIGKPLCLVEPVLPKGDCEPKVLGGYGLLRTDSHNVLWRFVDRGPVSHVTTAFLAWYCQQLATEWKCVLVLLQDRGSCHIS